MELIAQLVINISTPRLRWQADYTRSPIAWLQVFLIQKHLGRQRDGDVTNLQGDMRSKVQSGSKAKSWGSVEAFWSAVNLHRGRVTAFWAPRDAPGVIRSQVTSKFWARQNLCRFKHFKLFVLRGQGGILNCPLAGINCGIATQNWLYYVDNTWHSVTHIGSYVRFQVGINIIFQKYLVLYW